MDTKDARIRSGPVKVLNDFAGTGLKDLEIRVRGLFVGISLCKCLGYAA
jgi:hypothetical protein